MLFEHQKLLPENKNLLFTLSGLKYSGETVWPATSTRFTASPTLPATQGQCILKRPTDFQLGNLSLQKKIHVPKSYSHTRWYHRLEKNHNPHLHQRLLTRTEKLLFQKFLSAEYEKKTTENRRAIRLQGNILAPPTPHNTLDTPPSDYPRFSRTKSPQENHLLLTYK